MAYYPSQRNTSSSASHGSYPAAPSSHNPYGGGGGRYPQASETHFPPAQVNPHMSQRAPRNRAPGPEMGGGGGQGASPMIPGAAKEQDDEYILYIIPDHTPSQKAHQLASKSDKVKIENIHNLKKYCSKYYDQCSFLIECL